VSIDPFFRHKASFTVIVRSARQSLVILIVRVQMISMDKCVRVPIGKRSTRGRNWQIFQHDPLESVQHSKRPFCISRRDTRRETVRQEHFRLRTRACAKTAFRSLSWGYLGTTSMSAARWILRTPVPIVHGRHRKFSNEIRAGEFKNDCLHWDFKKDVISR
jgi:hypothetical protein